MRKKNFSSSCLIPLLAAILITGCRHPLSKTAFLQLYLDSMEHRFPDGKFTAEGDSTIIGDYRQKKIYQYIDNAFSKYNADPDSLGSILHTYILSAIDVYTSPGTLQSDNIVPVIKPVDYLDFKNMPGTAGAKKDFELAHEPYNQQLMIVYAADSRNGISYLSHDSLQRLGIPKDSLRQVAVNNIARLLPEIQIHRFDSTHFLYLVTAGGNYEASLLLLDSFWTKKNLPVSGDFVIGIPCRGILMVTGTRNKEELSIMKDKANEIYSSEPYKISTDLYRRVNGKFIKFE